MSDKDHFMEIYGELPRAGPGDTESTRKAYGLIHELPADPRILDIGCGPGVQTLELASLSKGRIVAIDLLPRMIERVKESVKAAGLAERIDVITMDMNKMDFPDDSFDLVWSEGALYIMGFRNGLEKVKKLVKPGGFVMVSEAVWLKPNPPKEIQEYWEAEYPAIGPVEDKLKTIRKLGYTEVGHFPLPSHSWLTDYYTPMENRINFLEGRWKDEPSKAQDVIAEARKEMDMFHRYSDYYGYCYFVMKKDQ